TTCHDGRKGLPRLRRVWTWGEALLIPVLHPETRIHRASSLLGRVGILALVIGAVNADALHAQEPVATPDSSALLDAVRRTNPRLVALRAALDAAEARARATGFAPPATLSAEIEEVPRVIDVLGAESMRLELGREFLTGGRRDARRAVAEQDVRRADLELQL